MRPQHVTDIEPACIGRPRSKPQPPKPCEWCGELFSQREDEQAVNYRRRKTCCYSHGKKLAANKNRGDLSEPDNSAMRDPKDFTCANCAYRFEDSDFGGHCGPCTTGQNFTRKEQ